MFKRAYIESKINFYAEVDKAPAKEFLGAAYSDFGDEASLNAQFECADNTFARRVDSARSAIKSFVIYQLSNSLPPNGSGVGCGFYDEDGEGDNGGIARLMNQYVFGFCFNPEIDENNIFLFLDYCLSHLSSSFFSDVEGDGYVATTNELPGGLDPHEMGRYWRQYGKRIRELKLNTRERCVFTSNYTAFYRDDLDGVFAVLDELADA